MYIAIVLAAICILAAITDLRTQRIPNLLTYSSMAMFLAWHAALAGTDGLLFSLTGLGAGFGLLIVPHLLGMMGAGDVKFLAAAGAALGHVDVVWAFLLASLAGGVYALIVMLFTKGTASRLFSSLGYSLRLFACTGRIDIVPGGKGMPRLCYGVALSAGTLAVIAWRTTPLFAA